MEILNVNPSKPDVIIKQCKNCNTEFSGTFCSDCGQKHITERITVRRIFSELLASLTNLEKGFWYTFKMLFVNPGEVIRNFINGQTVRYYSPLRYLLLWIAISVGLSLSTGLYDRQQETVQDITAYSDRPEVAEKQRQLQQQVNTEMRKYLNLVPLLILPFMGLASYWVFRKRGQNYAEHLVLNAYVYGHTTAIGIAALLLVLLVPSLIPFLMLKVMLVSIIYYAYVYRSFYSIRLVNASFKAILTTLIGYSMVLVFFGMVGMVAGIFMALK